jgi:class 3 adenylate cyclase/tetratricopeptide (TPR) repeat protein
MRCPSCASDNPDDGKFCAQCGATFKRRCAKCGFENSSTARFCSDCGSPISAAGNQRALDAPVSDGERRHLTVLFCDLVSSTQIAARLDPEDWRDIAAAYQRSAAEAVTRFGGHVAKYLGDGLVVYFGFPEAHEDDGERAVRSGLAIVDSVAALSAGLDAKHNVKLAVRVGIHTGSVVVGHGGGMEADVFGDAPNIASRVQTLAEPDSVLITAALHQLVSGLFIVEDRGAQPLKGIEHPVQLYRVIQPIAARRHRHGPAVHALTAFVGRDHDMRLVLEKWERAREGAGQLVLVTGEPGIGKSRLAEEFRARIKEDAHLWIDGAGEQFFESTPFHAVTQILGQGFGWRGDESAEQRTIQLERSLELAGLKLDEAVPLFAEMLNLPIPQKYPPLLFAPDQKRKRLLSNLLSWVLNLARLQPMVIAIEDMHWVDPSTLELMHTLSEQAATAPLMLLCTARPGFRAPWPARAHHVQITLRRLNDTQTREMVMGVVARVALSSSVIDAVVKRSDGIPLFTEELTRLMLEGDGRSIAREIPATLQDLLTARLDRLGPAKEVAQIAAVIGREFSYELLHAVVPMPQDDLRSALTRLNDAELIYTRGIAPYATYQFKHALIQDAAYEALLKSRRKEIHRRVALAVTEKFPAIAEAQPEVVARHWTEAAEAEPAVAAWKKAADAAYGRRAFKEAGDSYRQALAMLNTLPESTERDAKELELVSTLARVMMTTLGYSSPEAGEATARAHALAEKSGNLALLVQQLTLARGVALGAGDHRGAGALADQILELGQREGSPVSVVFGHTSQLQVRFYRGDFAGVEEHFASLSGLFEAPALKQFPGGIVIPRCFAGLGAWAAGHPAIARERIAQAIAFAHNGKSPYDLAYGRWFESWMYRFLREPLRAEATATEVLAISEENGFSSLRSLARIVIGSARAQLDKAGEGVPLIRQGLADLAEIGARIGFTDFLTCLAEAQARDGATPEALGTIEDALQVNPEELVFRPSMMTCRGELRLKLGQTELAEADFREAIALAQKMNAKSFELRAATSLARLLMKQGKRDEARAMLFEIYNWFTEGFDTTDQKDAKALLDESPA